MNTLEIHPKKNYIMKTLVIHPKDPSTDFLKNIYKDIPNCTILDTGFHHVDIYGMIAKHDRIICLGHGCPEGLFSGLGGLVIDCSHADIMRDKSLICVWCNADKFMVQHDLHGFYTGMFISEVSEATFYGIKTSQIALDVSNNVFAILLGKYIDFENRLQKILESYNNPVDRVVQFNRVRLFDTTGFEEHEPINTLCHKFTVYVTCIHDTIPAEEVKELLNDNPYLDMVEVFFEGTANVGEWDDDHILNWTSSGREEYEKFFMDK